MCKRESDVFIAVAFITVETKLSLLAFVYCLLASVNCDYHFLPGETQYGCITHLIAG